MEPHRNRLPTAVGFDLALQHPGAVLAAVVLLPLEAHAVGRVARGADHPEPLRAGERSQSTAQVDQPRGVAPVVAQRVGHLGPLDDLQPGRVVTQVVDVGEQHLGGTRGIEIGDEIHPAIVAARPAPLRTDAPHRGRPRRAAQLARSVRGRRRQGLAGGGGHGVTRLRAREAGGGAGVRVDRRVGRRVGRIVTAEGQGGLASHPCRLQHSRTSRAPDHPGSTWTSKWRWARQASPVAPTYPITWPAFTGSPCFRSGTKALRWA